MRDTPDITELFYAIIGRIHIILACAGAGLLGALFFAVFIIPAGYTSSVSLYVNSSPHAISSGDINLNDLTASQRLVSTCIVILRDDSSLEQAARLLFDEYEPTQLERWLSLTENNTSIKLDGLRKAISINAADNTEILQIDAVTQNAELSARICEIMAEIAPAALERTVGAGSVEAIGVPKIADKPSSPNILNYSLAGFVFGGAISATIVILARIFDNRVKDSRGLAKRYDIPILAEIISFNSKQTLHNAPAPLTEYLPEAYKTLRANLLFSLARSQKRTVIVSSAIPSEGKSITCANLAVAMAQAGQKTLLLDADLRDPSQHSIFRCVNDKGLSTLLSGVDTLEAVLIENIEHGLDLLPAGPVPPNPSELLGSKHMTALLDRLEKNYDCVLVDTPAVNSFADALLMAGQAAGVMLVTRRNFCTYDELTKAVMSIEFSGAEILGIALNDVEEKPGFLRKLERL